MSPEAIGIIGLVVLLILLFAGMWIGAAMAIVGFVGYAVIRGVDSAFGVVSQIPFSTVGDYPLIAVPMFIFMGVIIFRSGVGADLYYTAFKWVGQQRGGLAMATVFACVLFGAITGVSGPAVVTMGKVAVPEMRKYKYDDKLATGSIVCAGTLAFLIPPSVAFIIYGILTENSIGKLFIAGFLPGILLASLFVLTIMLITLRDPKAGPAGQLAAIMRSLFPITSSVLVPISTNITGLSKDANLEASRPAAVSAPTWQLINGRLETLPFEFMCIPISPGLISKAVVKRSPFSFSTSISDLKGLLPSP